MIIYPDLKNQIKFILFKILVLFAYIIHFFISNLYGVFALCLLLYFSSNTIGLGQPYSANELILWLDNLPDDFKTTVFSSLLTIVGFLIVFSIGLYQQKQHFISQMKIEAASTIEDFFNEASRRATDIEIYAHYLLKVTSVISEGTDQDLIDFHMYNLENETNKFIHAREILKSKSIEVHRFQGKYSLILASSWGVIKQLDKAINALQNITEAMWIPTPVIYSDTSNKVDVFMHHINIEKCQNFIDVFEENYSMMNSTTGGLRGRLLAPITGMNFSFLIALLKLK
ncbi:MAG: hypothetical protein R3271_00070 [Methylophaga sp.]|uniref:hypothetical protein n=1 Tax=Methylophaga sp. TaxID=2024840 RepID=UPI00299F46DB|nr:hypothetical protein [Methylophaga sp.]MDX1748693.1 hypothetical protein [Methylophaga sp.]